jgi:hypothetical protein
MAQALQQQSGAMTDAINGKESHGGPADETGKQLGALLNSAIVVEKRSGRLLDERLQTRHLMRLSIDVKDGEAAKVEFA